MRHERLKKSSICESRRQLCLLFWILEVTSDDLFPITIYLHFKSDSVYLPEAMMRISYHKYIVGGAIMDLFVHCLMLNMYV